jgi:predicted dehydrogenase
MNVLICGLGSIGQRHVRILRKILGEQITIGAVRVRKRAIVINDDLTAIEGIDPISHYNLIEYPSYSDAFEAGQHVVFVTNPVSMHVETALMAVKKRCHVFIEKPLSHNLIDIEVLRNEVVRQRVVAAVGYQLRFHPMLERVEQLLRQRTIGDIVSADVHFGEWLPGMHPYEDYRESHAARADQGGGVVLALSHEIDLVAWLFGSPISVVAAGGHLSDLSLEGVEDTADLLLTYNMDGRSVPVHIHLDFVQRIPRRRGIIVGTHGSIEWDYFSNELNVSAGRADIQTTRYSDFRRNLMFERQASDFFEAIRTNRDARVSLAAGLQTLKVCLAARQAMQHGNIQRL